MNAPDRTGKAQPNSNAARPAVLNSPSGDAANVPPADEAVDVNQLSAEEQMARFEQALKEDDWGHQPC